MADEAALRLEHAETLAELERKSDEVKRMKEEGADGKAIEQTGQEVSALKDLLPMELLSGKDAKKRQKKLAAEAKAQAAEEAKAAAGADGKSGDGKSGKKKKKSKTAIVSGADFVNTTPVGEKKDLSGEMAAAYEPPAVEAAWDAWWEQSGFYTCDARAAADADPADRFVMVIPPPNVTGSLHIGHALTCAIEDALTRWHRMQGKHVLWLPGTDHAGIATQAVVEKKLMRERKQSRYDLGREAFLQEVWKWKNANGAHILTQLRRLGASVDHSRTVFTMDEPRSVCVTEAFVRMFDAGLVYRDTRLVNWSHALNTALSDIEVDHEDLAGRTLRRVKGHDPSKQYEFGTLTSFAYQLAREPALDGPAEGDEAAVIVVATTRLETMLGDSAVAVNPEDPRYAALHGKHVWHPFRRCAIPIVLDAELVDMEFGTGAVKITPAHDPNDFACGRRHGLEELSILNDDGSINGVCGAPFEGLMRYDARVKVEEELTALGLFRGKESHAMQIPICSRSGDVIEPRLKPQWWVKCAGMAKRAADAVRSKELKLVPESAEHTWFSWLDNSQDWCVSRQLWWGHRIPAYRVARGEGQEPLWVVGRTEQEARARAAAQLGLAGAEAAALALQQDPDVLDTWFSSGLFPFSTTGWAQEGEAAATELRAFFPGALLETGHDIIFFWVARMVMMSLQLTDQLPFKEVFLHAMVRDKFGRKMSKSLGNVVAPEQVIEGVSLAALHAALEANTNLPEHEIEQAKEGQRLAYGATDGIPQCGADALRLGLLAYTGGAARDVNLDISLVAAHRRFCNKLWQATKFCMMNLGDGFAPQPDFLAAAADPASPARAALAMRDRWMLSRLAAAAASCNAQLLAYNMSAVVETLHSLFLEQLCDVYVEAVKPVMRAAEAPDASEHDTAARQAARNVLWWTLDAALRLMHPLMPFVTEELWQRLPGRPARDNDNKCSSIMVAHYPGAEPRALHKADAAAAQETAALAALRDEEAEAYMAAVGPLAACMRSLAADFQLASSRQLVFRVKVAPEGAEATHRLLAGAQSDLAVLGKAKEVQLLALDAPLPAGCAAKVHDASTQVFLELAGVVDPEAELAKIAKAAEKLGRERDTLQARLDSDSFDKVKPEAQEKMRADWAEASAKLQGLAEQRAMFEAYAAELSH